jgi:hypothetical protein
MLYGFDQSFQLILIHHTVTIKNQSRPASRCRHDFEIAESMGTGQRYTKEVKECVLSIVEKVTTFIVSGSTWEVVPKGIGYIEHAVVGLAVHAHAEFVRRHVPSAHARGAFHTGF